MSVFGQAATASLSGLVTDSSAAAIPGVQVVALNTQTGVSVETKTNESGLYSFPSLPPGQYQVSAKKDGFRTYVANDVRLEVGAQAKIDISLEIGSLSETVEVKATAESPLETVSVSVSNVVSQKRIMDLPLAARNAGALVGLQAGVQGDNFNGLRIASQNVTLDGINIQDARFQGGALGGNLVTFNSVDRIGEFRVITSPADAEAGRGSAQVQMVTRSGGNEFHGSLFEFHRNHKLNANTYFNNLRGRNPDGTEVLPRNFLIRNQFGGRLEGPILKNKTFFFVHYEGQRQVSKNSVTSQTLTATARQGLYRFFPGAQNQNANGAAPVVDLNGNPIRPAAATGDLRTVNLMTLDPNRPRIDQLHAAYIARQPLPNDFRAGDGLNTAGYTWQRRATNDLDSFSLKLDHNFNDRHRASFTWLKEGGSQFNGFSAQPFPTIAGGDVTTPGAFYSLNVTSTLKPTLLNEFRAGAQRKRFSFRAPWDEGVGGLDVVSKLGNQPFYFNGLTYTDPVNVNSNPQGRLSPIYEIADNMTWLKGKHSFKGGFDFRFASTNGYNSFYVMPEAQIGAGAVPAQGIGAEFGQNVAGAQNLLYDLSGSLALFVQQLNSPGGPNPQYIPGEFNQRTWRQREYSFFFKDDWKITPSVTLNLGVRYEYYSVPFEANGKSVRLVGGSGSIFGISGTDYGALFRPGATGGSLTRQELVGRTTSNPDGLIYNPDKNNFAPAVGVTWALPWFGKNKTILRAGYSIAYDRNLLRNVDIYAGDLPGLNRQEVYRSSSLLNIYNTPLPLTPTIAPMATVPLTDRSLTLRSYDSNLVTPYNQNFNFSLQRELPWQSALSIRYVGSKGTKLLRGVNVNEVNIFENGILDAFRLTQAGGHSPLLDRIFMGLTTGGRRVDGTTFTGSDYARLFTTTRDQLANNNVGAFADFLNRNTVAGAPGELLRRAGLPENFVVANPQYNAANLLGNYANSTFHSLQVEWDKRFARDWNFQANYVWSKALGEEEGAAQQLEDQFRTQRNRSLEKRLLTFHVAHAFKANGTWELPFGRGKTWGSNSGRLINSLIGGWTTGWFANIQTGNPFFVFSNRSTFNVVTADNSPVAVGPVTQGKVTRDGQGVHFFPQYTRVADPARQSLTPALGAVSTLWALADQSGNIVMRTPAPGQLGTMSPTYFIGPGFFNLDLSVIKRIRITERINTELRADLIGATNTPQFNNPNSGDINDPAFGRITGAAGSRLIILGARISF